MSLPVPVPRLPIDWLYAREGDHPAVMALQWEEERLDFSRLRTVAEGWGGGLFQAGLRPGQVLGLVTDDPWLTASTLYGTLCLGALLLPLDPGMAEDRRNSLLAQAGCSLLLTNQGSVSAPQGVRLIAPSVFHQSGGAPFRAHPDGPGERGGLIIATSGTTGTPKGVLLLPANLAASVRASRRRLPLHAGDCWLNCLPLFHIGGVIIFYRCLEAGASMLLHRRFGAAQVWLDVRQQGVTHLSLVPPMLSRLLDVADGRAPEWLRVVLVGGGPLDPGLARRALDAGWPLCVSYGMSETGSQLATDCSEGAGLVPGRAGRPLAGFEVQLSGLQPGGVAGRIRVRGPAVMAGYVNPELKPGDGLEQGWFQTGDLGQLDREGGLILMGRADELLLSAGKSIHPTEVETRVAVCPGIREVAVCGQRDLLWGDRLVLFYSGNVAEGVLDEWLRQNLPGALRPRTLIRLEKLPRNPMGKVERSALRRLLG